KDLPQTVKTIASTGNSDNILAMIKSYQTEFLTLLYRDSSKSYGNRTNCHYMDNDFEYPSKTELAIEEIFYSLIKCNHLHVFKAIYEQFPEFHEMILNMDILVLIAISNNSLETIDFLLDHAKIKFYARQIVINPMIKSLLK
ncbi:hypothetical protein CYY_009141, partial [Polysphondylium violaceum]